jgi:hypothetical protein
MKEVQISGFVPEDVRDDFERLVKARGLKKGFVLEQALRHHLRALRELPGEFIVPATVVLTKDSFEGLLKQLRSRSKPTSKLRKLMRGEPISEDGLY